MILETPKRQQQSYLFVFVLFVALKKRIPLEICILFCFGTKKCSVELSVVFFFFDLLQFSSSCSWFGVTCRCFWFGVTCRWFWFGVTCRWFQHCSLEQRSEFDTEKQRLVRIIITVIMTVCLYLPEVRIIFTVIMTVGLYLPEVRIIITVIMTVGLYLLEVSLCGCRDVRIQLLTNGLWCTG